MQQSNSYDLITDRGSISLMLVDDTIVAYRGGSDVLIHHVPERHCGRPARLGQLFQGLHLGGGLIVGRIVGVGKTILGFYNAHPDAGFAWGYVWNVDAPERSYWDRAERIAAAINPADLPFPGKLAALGFRIARLAGDVSEADPRAVAMAISRFSNGSHGEEDVADLIGWLALYQEACWSCYRAAEDGTG